MTARQILIVDDDADACATLSDVLAENEYESDSACGAAEAMVLADRHDYQIALLDYRMPGMNGIDLFGRLRSSGVVAVLITGHTNPEVASAAATAGMHSLLAKPLDIALLLPILADVVKTH